MADQQQTQVLLPAGVANSAAVLARAAVQPGDRLDDHAATRRGRADLKSVLVNGLLVQDVFGAPSPNGAFWSIPVEVQLYLFFPLLVFILWRFGSWVMVGAVTTVVVMIGVLAPHVSIVDKLTRFTPQFAVLFALGMAAAGIVRLVDGQAQPNSASTASTPGPASFSTRRMGADASVAGAGRSDPGARADRRAGFGMDGRPLLLGRSGARPGDRAVHRGLAAGRPAPAVRFLDTRPVRGLGSISYSLYLIHAPIVVVVYTQIVGRWLGHGVSAFLAMLAIAVPLSLVSRGFSPPYSSFRSRGTSRGRPCGLRCRRA